MGLLIYYFSPYEFCVIIIRLIYLKSCQILVRIDVIICLFYINYYLPKNMIIANKFIFCY